jgi:hypothetical protein
MLKRHKRFSSKWWWPLYELVVHLLVGSILFLLILMPVIALEFLTRELTRIDINETIVWGLVGIKYLIMVLNVILFLTYLSRITYSTIKKIWGDYNA